MARYINPVAQLLDISGDPLAQGRLYFFESGTSTPKTTYSDVNLTVANTHPVVLSGDGRVPNIFYSGSAKVILTDADEVQLWERDPVSGGSESSFGQSWDAVSVYGLNEVVTYNDVLYVSIIANNQNNDPAFNYSSRV